MAFLNKVELKTKVPVEIIDLITNSDDTTVDEIIEDNIDVMKTYLFKKYDTDAIFSATGNARSKVIRKHLKSLVVADLYEIRQKPLSEASEKKYDEAMRWLESMLKSNMEADLPTKQIDTDGDGTADGEQPFMRLGSRKSYKNHF